MLFPLEVGPTTSEADARVHGIQHVDSLLFRDVLPCSTLLKTASVRKPHDSEQWRLAQSLWLRDTCSMLAKIECPSVSGRLYSLGVKQAATLVTCIACAL